VSTGNPEVPVDVEEVAQPEAETVADAHGQVEESAPREPDGSEVAASADAEAAHAEGAAEAEDAATDIRMDGLDDGASTVGSSPALPFVMTVREHFAALDDVVATGDARVDAATALLADVPDLPTVDHVEIYDDVHSRLQDALSDTEVR